MIMLSPAGPGKPHPGHMVKCLRPIGSFPKTNTQIHIMVMPMEGNVYKPGKNPDGSWIDKVGKKDDRFMVFNKDFYAVGTREELDSAFQED